MGTRVIAILAAMLCGLSAATELFAYVAHLDPGLGHPWYRYSVLALYPSWDILRWAWMWGGRVPSAFKWPGLVGLGIAGITLYNLWPREQQLQQPQAHWASWRELQRAELFGNEGQGVVLGKIRQGWKWIMLRYHGGLHLLVVAGTQTGKTSSVVLPTLLEYQGSMIIHDPKGGLYAKTAGYRASLGNVILLAPLQADTDCYNLWESVRIGTDDEVRDVDSITHYLTNPGGTPLHDETSLHFRDLVKQFFRGVSLYGLHTGIATTGAEFDALVNQTAWADLLTVMKAHDHPVIRRAAILAERPGERELGSLQTTMARALDMFVDPRVAHMTSTSSFCLDELRDQDKPCSLYICIPFGEQERLQALVDVLLQILIDHCTSKLTGWAHPVLAMIEEYPSLGRFRPISRALNYAAEYQLQFCLITPSMEELERVYGTHHNHLEGCRVQAVFGLSDATVAKRFSGRAGTREETHQRRTRQQGGRQSITEDVKEAPLLNTTGFLDLGERDVAVFAGRYKRVCQQSRYYEHTTWDARSKLAPPYRQAAEEPCKVGTNTGTEEERR